ncbi:hypothetical protein [Mucilaginibacter aquariorum]|uniref:Glycosyltransferase subfamily 4-like N-terminal domain-containing protein n=1 Tax=Mucilaginibacter aquariorum TaxID=2967225 RepID=A0ABT1SYH6_9SPHI|nr:hypothetical protein [Mucilaginibacter aquariorum]MCQ6957275.1 hypothetical protein [Mucilaginibacter aquariorum]
MGKILIISNKLSLGGAEKLAVELALFAKKNDIEPTVLILENYGNEHYDTILKEQDIKVIRTRIKHIKHFRAPLKMAISAWWAIKLKYFSGVFYDSIHVIGLYNIDAVLNNVIHQHRFFWNVNNSIQYHNKEYPYQREIFANKHDTIVNINEYQAGELYDQYGKEAIKTKMVQAKLFVNAAD